MRTRLPNTVHDWERMLKRVYEKQGPSGFAKYQYSISGILQLKKDGISIGTILEYCGDIANPKDVLIEAISGIMLNKDMETTVRVAAATALRSLIPRMRNYPGLKAASIILAMREVVESTGERALQEAFTDTIEVADRRIQECPKAYAIRT
jgi:hypothetical protein